MSKIFMASLTGVLVLSYTNCSQGFKAGRLGNVDVGSGGSIFNDGHYDGKNIVPITIGSCSFPNAPCVSVTVCLAGSSTCSRVDNVLLDTGSFGLRVFKSALGLTLPSLHDASGKSIAECQSYVGGSADWGPVSRADVILGSERASNVPVQVIDAGFATAPSSCHNVDASPSDAGFNGILGVGLANADCGSVCETNVNNLVYFACSGTSCTSTTLALTSQVSNPISFMPHDNNGVMLVLPTIANTGAPTATGKMIMGIGTQANNTIPNVSVYDADEYYNFKTEFHGQTYTNSFIDSGSNALFFPSPSTSTLPACSDTGSARGFYCPSAMQSFSATVRGATNATNSTISFQIVNAEQATAAGNTNLVYPDLGGSLANGFDWGLPFFLGRTVFVGIDGKSTPLGRGPFWAF